LEDFQAESQEIKIVFNSQLIVEGIDLPCADTVIFNDNSSTPSKIVQIIGRLMRPFPGKLKSLVIVPSVENCEFENMTDEDVSIFGKLAKQFYFARTIVRKLMKFPEMFDLSKFKGVFSSRQNCSDEYLKNI
jgi:predicted helicase